MTHDPNHPIWADIEGSAHYWRNKLNDTVDNHYESVYDEGPVHNSILRLESMFDRQGGAHATDWRLSMDKLEPRWGNRISGSTTYGHNAIRSPEVEEYHLRDQNLERSPERVANVSRRAAEVERIQNKRAEKHGDNYETHVFPKGTYPEATESHIAVTYHKPTGEPVSSLSFGSDGYVGTWAALEEHQGTAAISAGLAAHKYLKSIGHPTGILHSRMTTPDSKKVLQTLDPDNTSLVNRDPLDKYNSEDTADMNRNTIRQHGVPERLSDVHSTPTTEDYARLSDMTGRHPMNFMAISPRLRDRQIAAHHGYDTSEKSKLDPTVLVRAREIEDVNGVGPSGIQEHSRGVSHNAHEAMVARSVDRLLNTQSTRPVLPHWNDVLYADLDGERAALTRRRLANRTAAMADKTEGRAEDLHDAGMYVHEEEYKPRTTEERLAQDPLARARIIRGKAFYDG